MSEVTNKTDLQNSNVSLGFWIYLMTDGMLFASLFATFMVLRNNVAGNVSGAEIFSLPFVLTETILLLTSSFTCGLALLYAHRDKASAALKLLTLTGLLGLSFLGMEIHEFSALISEGHSWSNSAFLSSFFGLVGTHGLHITVGLIWLRSLWSLISRKGFTKRSLQNLTLFSLFWHFLDIIWICIFTIVYLVGVL